jgi:hypothetical protein
MADVVRQTGLVRGRFTAPLSCFDWLFDDSGDVTDARNASMTVPD